MKAKILIGLIMSWSLVGAAAGSQLAPSYAQEMKKAEAFFNGHFSEGRKPPFSFIYGGRPSASFLAQWKYAAEVRRSDVSRSELVRSYTDPRTGLAVEAACTVYRDYPAVEWVLKFKNTSSSNTALMESIKAVDVEFPFSSRGDFVLHRALGSNAERSDFAPLDETLIPGVEIAFGPKEGRSSGNGALPFFNIEAAGEGVVAGLGWTGKWMAAVRREGGAVHLSAGMERTHFVLHPGEEVRSPRIVLLFWSGDDRMAGHNIFRRFILKHHTPQRDGRPVTLPLASGLGFGGPSPCNEYSCATESFAIAMAYRLAQFDLLPEAGWIDAGWYEGADLGWWRGVGNWVVNRKNFPNGIRPVSEVAKKLGMGFVLWFEPERVYQGTRSGWSNFHRRPRTPNHPKTTCSTSATPRPGVG
ncbi:MAG: alpha-galactosidase [Acidobacteriota bacterium]